MDLVSSTFNAQASLAAAKGAPFDVVLVSSDGVRFHTHKSVLHAASSNRFDGLLPQAQSRTSSVRLSDGSLTLDLVLHAVYGLALGPYAPTWATLERAVAAMDRYAVPLPRPTDPLFIALLANLQRPGGALDLYCLAAHHSLESLAVAASAHLLSLELNTLTDAWAAHCGAVYLNRLFLLHLHRTDAIKRILSVPPAQHAHTPGCIEEDKQRDVARPWALAVAMLIMEARSAARGEGRRGAERAAGRICPRCSSRQR